MVAKELGGGGVTRARCGQEWAGHVVRVSSVLAFGACDLRPGGGKAWRGSVGCLSVCSGDSLCFVLPWLPSV